MIGRDDEKKRLIEFLQYDSESSEDSRIAWFQLAGVAGQGKSRLAFNLISELTKRDLIEKLGLWRAGFLTDSDINSFEDCLNEWEPSTHHLLIFDYVIGREIKIKSLLQKLIHRDQQKKFPHKIRILLLERQRWDQGSLLNAQHRSNNDASRTSILISDKAQWFLNLREADDPNADRLKSYGFEDGVLELKALTIIHLKTIVRKLVQQLSEAEFTLTDPELTKTLERIDVSGRPLYAYLLAQQLSVSIEGYNSWTEIDLLKFQLERDKFRWDKAFNKNEAPTWGDNHPAMKLAVLATIVRKVNFEDDKIENYFGIIDSRIRKEAISITSSYLINSSQRPRDIFALQPDLLGEWFVLYCFFEGFKFEELLDFAWQHSPIEMATFLQRITQDFIDLYKECNEGRIIHKLLSHKHSSENYYLALAFVAVDIAHKLYHKNLPIPENIIIALEHAANLLNNDAMNFLGLFYLKGIGVVRDLEKALYWYQQAVKHGSTAAIVNLGVCFTEGKDIKQNWEKAIDLFQWAADLGNNIAMLNLGVRYEKGEGVEQNWDKAVDLYQQAIKHGSSEAMVNLAQCYAKGTGVEQNWNEAFHLYRQAAEQGISLALNNLGSCYEKGEGVEQNWEKAIIYYQRAALQGNPSAMVNLGAYYQYGPINQQNWNKAVDLYQKAFKGGETKALDNIRYTLLEIFLGKGNYITNRSYQRSNNKFPHLLSLVSELDPPIMSGDWNLLNEEKIVAYINAIIGSLEILGIEKILDDTLTQHVRLLPVDFYKDCFLVDIQFYNPSNNNTLISSAIFNNNRAILLDGTPELINALNKYFLSLGDRDSAIQYLQFHNSYVQDKQGAGPFQIISNLNEIPFNEKVCQSLVDDIKSLFFIPQYIEGSFEKEGWQKFKACVLFKDALFAAAFKVFYDGMISLEDNDDDFTLYDLPIHQRKYYGVFRTQIGS